MQKLTVRPGGIIGLEGKKYMSAALLSYVGEKIQAFVDDSIGGADAVCFDAGREFITNAQNPELWAEMTKDVLRNA